MEFLLGFYAGLSALIWWQVSLFVILMIWCLIALFNEVLIGGSILIAILLIFTGLVGIVDFNSLSVLDVIENIGIYIVLGCCWSLFKYRIRAKEIVKRVFRRSSETFKPTQARLLEEIKDEIPNTLISYWILYFPISMIKFCCDDLFDYLINKLGKVYDYIALSVVRKALNYNVRDL